MVHVTQLLADGSARNARGQHQHAGAWAALLVVWVFWGATYIAIRIADYDIPPLLLAAVRYLIAGAVLFAAVRLSGRLRRPRPGSAATGPGPFSTAAPGSVASRPVASGTVASRPAAPGTVGAGAPSFRQWAGMAVAGTLTGLAAATGELAHFDPARVGTSSVLALLYLIGPGSLLALTCYVIALRRLPTAKVSTYAYVNPVVAVSLGVLFLGERLTVPVLAGGGIVVVAVALLLGKRTRTVNTVPEQAVPDYAVPDRAVDDRAVEDRAVQD
jgi:drug/metabolite transporter (DMT)-like permease